MQRRVLNAVSTTISRHSAGKPVVAGWSYSWCAQLGDFSSSWTAPIDVSRVPIEVDAHDIAGQQMRVVIDSLPAGIKPLFVFDAGYDPTRLSEQFGEDEAAVLVRLRRNRCFYAEPTAERRLAVGRPSTHGAKFVCNDPSTWPSPDFEHNEDDEGYGCVRVRAWRKLHARVQNHPGRGTRKTKPVIRGTLILLEVAKLPKETRAPRAFWLWWRGSGKPDLSFLWRTSGARTSEGLTSSTPSAFSRPRLTGKHPASDTQSKLTSGHGWCCSPSRSLDLPGASWKM